jgi:hypothetical protein
MNRGCRTRWTGYGCATGIILLQSKDRRLLRELMARRARGVLATPADRREHALGLAIFLVDGGIAGAQCRTASNTAAAA